MHLKSIKYSFDYHSEVKKIENQLDNTPNKTLCLYPSPLLAFICHEIRLVIKYYN